MTNLQELRAVAEWFRRGSAQHRAVVAAIRKIEAYRKAVKHDHSPPLLIGREDPVPTKFLTALKEDLPWMQGKEF